MRQVFDRWGVTSRCLSVDLIPSALLFLAGAERIERVDIADVSLSSTDVVLCLDSPALHRFTRHSSWSLERGQIVNIDHHATNERFGSVNLVAQRVSTTSLLSDWLEVLGESVDAPLATCLLTGMITDTESFWHEATPEALEAAARLMRAGAEYNVIVQHTLRNIPVPVLHLWAYVLERFQVDAARHAVWAVVPFTVFQQMTIAPEDVHPAVSGSLDRLLRNVRGMTAAFICAEEEPGRVLVDLRSRPGGRDVGALARRLGGGGHKAAAGFVVSGSPEEASQRVLDELDRA